MRFVCRLSVNIVATVAVLTCASAQRRQLWSGGSLYTYAHDGPNIILGYMRQDEQHLSGDFTFENISGKRAQAKKVILKGTKTRDGAFWPHVRYEVRHDSTSRWEPLGESTIGGRKATLVIKPEAKPVDLSVRLDIFQPLIGTYETGRVVFSSGDTSQFQLKELAPPGER